MRRLFITTSIAFILVGCGVQDDSVGAAQAKSVPSAPDVVSMTLPDLSVGLANEAFSSVDLVRAYLSRIERIDRAGPTLNAVISVNKDALKLAHKSDSRRGEGRVFTKMIRSYY